jgi:transcriptional regulator with XRE-family HTH domain
MNGSLISRRLIELGLSPEAFAVQLGCSISTVQNMKRGKRVRPSLAYKAAQILGVALEELVPIKKVNHQRGVPRPAHAS